MIISSPEYDTIEELFGYMRSLPWNRLRIVRLGGKWSATCFELSGQCKGKA